MWDFRGVIERAIVFWVGRKKIKGSFRKKGHLFYFFKKYFFRERGRKREKEGEKHQCAVASPVPPTGDLTHNPDMCPDWE